MNKIQMDIFSFDAERTRLVEPDLSGHWVIGAVVMRSDRTIRDKFSGMIDPSNLTVNKFVRENIIPYVQLPEYQSGEELLNAFWDFWMKHRSDRVIAVADFGAPVEGTLFAAAQALDLETREYLAPYPLHELGTRLFDAGIDPDVDRIEFANRDRKEKFIKHNPVDDAIVAGHCWFNAGELLLTNSELAPANKG